MARFEIEAAVKNAGGVKGDIAGISNSLDKLNDRYSSLTREIAKSTAVSRGLEGDLKALNAQFKSGAISQGQFERETSEVSMALASARQATGVFQSELTSLKATIRQNETGLDQYGKSVKKLEGYHRSFSGGIRSSNSVAIEFSRIIQDAPYGIQGVANNIQQLTTNFGYYAQSAKAAAAESGVTLTRMQLLKGAFSGLLSPVNLLTIAISVITAGWVAYQQWSQKAKKSTDEVAESFTTLAAASRAVLKSLSPTTKSQEEFVKSLNNVDKATLKGEINAKNEVRSLKRLYDATQNTTISLERRTNAAKELQRKYPTIFKNLSTEKILAGETAESYTKLANSLVALAKSKAYEEGITENTKTELTNLKEIAKEEAKIAEARKRQSQFSEALLAGGTVSGQQEIKVNEAIEQSQRRIEQLKTQNAKLTQENSTFESKISEYTASTLDNVKGTKTEIKSITDYASKLNDILSKSSNAVDLGGLVGGDLNTEKIRQKYASLYDDIDKFENKVRNDAKITENVRINLLKASREARIRLTANEASEQSNARISEEERVAAEILRIQNSAGIKAIQSREKELEAAKRAHDKELENIRKNGDDEGKIRIAADEAYRKMKSDINAKYDEKEFQAIADFVTRSNRNREQALIDQLEKETRLKIAAAEGDQKKIDAITKEFIERRGSIQQVQQQINLIAEDDGSILYKEIAQIELKLTQLRDKFKQGLISQEAFQEDLRKLNAQKTALDTIKSTLQDLGKFYGDSFATILTDGENAADSIAKAFKSMANKIISDLIRIAATKAFANIFSGGLTGLFGGIGKIFGFAGGGYTGNVGKKDIAGLVHGQEFVVNAEATKKYRNLLNAINSGRVVKPNAIASGITGNGSNNISVEVYGRLAGQDLLVSNKRTERNNKRFYGIR